MAQLPIGGCFPGHTAAYPPATAGHAFPHHTQPCVPRRTPAQLAARGDPKAEAASIRQQLAMIFSSVRQLSSYNIPRQETPRITAPV